MADFDWAKYEDKQPASFDWSKYEDEPTYQPQESKGLGGVATDALGKMLQSVYGIPAGLMALPGEAYGAVNQLATNPKRAAQNFGAGFGELGHGVLSAPGNIRDYLAKKELVSQQSPSFRLPESVLPKEYNYAEALGAEGNQTGDALIRGVPAGIASAPFVGKLMQGLADLPIRPGAGGRALNKVRDQLKERGMGNIGLPEDVLRDIEDHNYLRSTAANKRFLEKAKQGDYESLFKLQSDLGRLERGHKLNPFFSEREFGKDIGETRQSLLKHMKSRIAEEGHDDLQKLMSHGMNRYRQYMKLRPYIIGAAGLAASTQLPYYKELKKVFGQ
jgi:hypothetical protein